MISMLIAWLGLVQSIPHFVPQYLVWLCSWESWYEWYPDDDFFFNAHLLDVVQIQITFQLLIMSQIVFLVLFIYLLCTVNAILFDLVANEFPHLGLIKLFNLI